VVEHRGADATNPDVGLFVIEPIALFPAFLKVLMKLPRIDNCILGKAIQPFDSQDVIDFLRG
jgi:hypothetical protein